MIGELLDQNRAALRRLDATDDYDDKTIELASFLENHLALGLLLARSPELRSEPEVEAYLAETVPILERNRFHLKTFPRAIERTLALPFEDDEWRRVVEQRSAFEFFKELYDGTALAPDLAAVDLAPVDARLREIGEVEGYLDAESIPADLPTSHWWWWAPAQPPVG